MQNPTKWKLVHFYNKLCCQIPHTRSAEDEVNLEIGLVHLHLQLHNDVFVLRLLHPSKSDTSKRARTTESVTIVTTLFLWKVSAENFSSMALASFTLVYRPCTIESFKSTPQAPRENLEVELIHLHILLHDDVFVHGLLRVIHKLPLSSR